MYKSIFKLWHDMLKYFFSFEIFLVFLEDDYITYILTKLSIFMSGDDYT